MFSREDWTLFRSINTLGQKAGVPVSLLGALVIKELVDNALDAGANVTLNEAEGGWVIIQDDGPGIPHEGIETLFSIRRPLTSTKIVRLPLRGALGNGLRVVMGAVYASGGEIIVETGGQDDDPKMFKFTPRDDGHSDVATGPTDIVQGTRISIRLGEPIDKHLKVLASTSINFANFGTKYTGKTSPWWYDGEALFEMCHATAPGTSLASICKLFRDVTAPIAAEIVERIGVTEAADLPKSAVPALMSLLRKVSKAPKPSVLGKIDELDNLYRSVKTGTISAGQSPEADIPYVIEVFCRPIADGSRAEISKEERDIVTIMVNRTSITGSINTYRGKPTKLVLSGCGLRHYFDVPKDVPIRMYINITTPYMPITTDGKEPDLLRFFTPLQQAVKAAASKCKKATRKELSGAKGSQKEFIERYLEEGIAQASSNGQFRFSLRQLYYSIRPFLLPHFEKGLDYNYFATVITQIESETGRDIPGMYRDARGVIYHPHTREEIPLGTLSVEEYERPKWTFNKILYIEKKGFFPLLQDIGWPERNDCALMTSQGFASRAARDVLDLLGESQEDIYFFCIHDADAAGTMIYQSLVEATKARDARRVHVVNLGLDPEEAREMELQVEVFREEGYARSLPVADYIRWDDRDWLQTQRVELNAMNSETFIAWLDRKFEDYVGKVIPPKKVMEDTYREKAAEAVGAALTNKILVEGNYGPRLGALVSQIDTDLPFEQIVKDHFLERDQDRWDAPLGHYAKSEGERLVSEETPNA